PPSARTRPTARSRGRSSRPTRPATRRTSRARRWPPPRAAERVWPRSRREAFAHPLVVDEAIPDPVVQAVRSTLPQLDLERGDDETTPELGQRRVVAVPGGGRLVRRFELGAIGDDLALGRDQRAEAAPERAVAPVRQRLLA